MYQTMTRRRCAAIAVAAVATAAAALLVPTALLPPVLAVGVAAVAILALVSPASTTPSPMPASDIAGIVQALERVSRGVLDHAMPATHTPEAARIGEAVTVMTAQVRARVEQLQAAAQCDALTGMANRAHFQRLVERHLEQRAPDSLCCLMFIDIDGFKDVNDTLGHNLGDRLLQSIAERLRIAARLDELGADGACQIDDGCVTIARFGGDEFVIFLSNLPSEAAARKIANRVLRVMVEPFELSAHVAGVSASIGLAFLPGDATAYCDLLRAADTAMYHAKHLGRNRIEHFTPQLDADQQRQAALERDLREALARGEFELHYQPQYDCRTLRLSSAEALIRWRHPQRGLVSPCAFIPLAEKTNLICDIGEWVLREAAGAIARFEVMGLPLRISVNVSPQQLEQMEFVSLVKSTLARARATPRLLEIEITESLAMRDSEMAAERLGRLADLGVSIAIDDFGTGYSNLASLIRLPVSRLKIDRSLLEDVTERAEVRTLVQTIVTMANGLGFHSVAEGVETVEQLALLSGMGCDVVQGFFLSKPIEEAALVELLAETVYRDECYPKLAAI
jgi:diguanylate cyclase (GGDEF)-like protein